MSQSFCGGRHFALLVPFLLRFGCILVLLPAAWFGVVWDFSLLPKGCPLAGLARRREVIGEPLTTVSLMRRRTTSNASQGPRAATWLEVNPNSWTHRQRLGFSSPGPLTRFTVLSGKIQLIGAAWRQVCREAHFEEWNNINGTDEKGRVHVRDDVR